MKQVETSHKVKTVVVERHYTLVTKTCPQCGKVFERTKKAKQCSQACTQAASYARHAEARRKHRREKYHAEKQGQS
jgi:predicted RNA-binding Zn-ribbon protein involved in translation (DUF1610 family)